MYNPPHNTIATIVTLINGSKQSIRNISIKKTYVSPHKLMAKVRKKEVE
jgi:hypothetical protein